MELSEKYKVLNKNLYEYEDYKIIPVRFKDRYKIMKWRNDQLYHLRQTEKITREEQDYYFNEILLPQKKKYNPDQIIFSLFHKSRFVGYGGLVHINWKTMDAEVSLVIDTFLEKLFFSKYWDAFLKLLDEVLMDLGNFNKIYTYAFDLRPKIYEVLEKNNFSFEKNDTYIKGKKKINVKIHKKIINGK